MPPDATCAHYTLYTHSDHVAFDSAQMPGERERSASEPHACESCAPFATALLAKLFGPPTALVAMNKQAGSRYTPACATSRTLSGSASRLVCCSALSGAMATKITQAQPLLPYDHGRHYEGISSMCKDVCALPLFACAPRLMASDRAVWASRPSSSQTPRSCWSRRIETETLRVCRQRDGLRATACHAMAA